eukprot:COSAG06_NODE_63701_length_261_cov_1.271605_1_plen_63_part_01
MSCRGHDEQARRMSCGGRARAVLVVMKASDNIDNSIIDYLCVATDGRTTVATKLRLTPLLLLL